jgi:lipoprotein-releasing system ATP-binding protein
MNDRNPILSIEGVQRRFRSGAGELVVLDRVDLEIWPGEIVGLVGPSGSGKSSLLHVAGLLEAPTGGKVTLGGKSGWDLGDDARTSLRRGQLGFVYQFHHLLPEFTALENVELPGLIAGRPPRETKADAKRLLTKMGLGERLEHRPAQLSGGEQQRVAIARAMINKPRLILADEPTGNLDPESSRAVFDAMSALVRSEGTAAIIATHNFQLAKHMDRVVGLRNGRLVGLNDPAAGDIDPWAHAEMAQSTESRSLEGSPAPPWPLFWKRLLGVAMWASLLLFVLSFGAAIGGWLMAGEGAVTDLQRMLSDPAFGQLAVLGFGLTVMFALARATTQHMFNDEWTARLRPWARFWAKMVDLNLYWLVVALVVSAAASAMGLRIAEQPIVLTTVDLLWLLALFVAYPFLEAISVSTTGTSPGRALFRFSISRPDGARPSFRGAFARAWTCLFFGRGMGWISWLASYSHLLDRGSSLWDRDARTEVCHRGARWWSWIGPVIIVALWVLTLWGPVLRVVGSP